MCIIVGVLIWTCCGVGFQVQPHTEDGIPIDPYMQHGDFVRTGLLGFMGPVSTS